jgi:hypothetical protein
MYSGFLRFLLVLAFCVSLPAWGQSASPQDAPQNGGDFSTNTHPTEKQKVPAGVVLVKGAWASASDSVTPLPEGGSVANDIFSDPYFGMTYALPAGWTEKHKGPPPSDTGRYVIAQITPTAAYKGPNKGSILITAQDMFFTPLPVSNALELIKYTKDNLQADYQVELKPTETTIAGHSFSFFAYWSAVAELHWYVAATQIRCHTLEFVLTSRDTKLLQSLFLEMEKMKLPAEASATGGTGGGDFPVCMKDYAREENVMERVDPVFTEHRYNPVPVRIVIDKKGKVKHIHFLSAFPEQAKAISDALKQWRFRPYLRNGQPAEVETGIMFGPQPRRPATASTEAAVSE